MTRRRTRLSTMKSGERFMWISAWFVVGVMNLADATVDAINSDWWFLLSMGVAIFSFWFMLGHIYKLVGGRDV